MSNGDLNWIANYIWGIAGDAWYQADSVRIGYEISFTRYFYKLQPMRTMEEIRADILALEKETEGLLEEIIGDGGK